MNPRTNMANNQRSSRYALRQDIVFQAYESEALLLDLENETIFSMNGTAARAMTLIVDGMPLGRALSVLSDEYDVRTAILKRDVKELLNALLERELIIEIEGDATTQ